MTALRHARLVAFALVVLPARSAAQQAPARTIDSLAAEVRALRAQLDTLRARLNRMPVPTPAARAAPDTAAGDELPALPAAAAAAARPATATARPPPAA